MLTFDNYLNTLNALINSHGPLKKLNKKQRKFQQKPWVTRGIQNLIHKENRLFKKYIKCNNHNNKNALHNEYKAHRNKLSSLMKQSKKFYYANYFKNSIKDMKTTWKGIKSIISLKAKKSTFSVVLQQISNLILNKLLNPFINI